MFIYYFNIIEEDNNQVLELVDKVMIQSTQYFPIYGFALIDSTIKKIAKLKKQQKEKLKTMCDAVEKRYRVDESALVDIISNNNYAMTYKNQVIAYALLKGNITPEEVEPYLKDMSSTHGNTTDYRRLLCAYDFVKYSENETL